MTLQQLHLLTKRLIALAVLLTALPTVAFASTSRIQALGPGDYFKDYAGVYTYLSGLPTVGNLVYAEIGNELINTNNGLGKPTTSDRAMGVILGSRFGTWGIHLRDETPAIGQGDAFGQPNVGFGGADPNGNTNESFDIMWGNTFGTLSLGARINRSFFKSEFDDGAGITSTFEFDPVYSGPSAASFRRVDFCVPRGPLPASCSNNISVRWPRTTASPFGTKNRRSMILTIN